MAELDVQQEGRATKEKKLHYGEFKQRQLLKSKDKHKGMNMIHVPGF